MFGQSSQTTGIFGNSATTAPATATPGGFGHQRNTTSLFTPATGTTSTALFSSNAAAPTTSAPASTTSLFGSTATNANQGTSFSFGNTATQQQQQQQQPQTQSLFGSTANKTNQGTSFSFGNATAQAQQPQQQKSLFGTNTTTATTTQQQPSLFGAPQQQQQQQQQQQGSSLLSLQAAFPDTNVPYFTIRPDGINRTTFPSNFFLGESSSSSTSPDSKTTSVNTFIYKGKETTISASNSNQQKDNSNLRRTFSSSAPSSSHPFGDKRTVLPGFLTGTPAQTSENATTGQKRFIDSNDSIDVFYSNQHPHLLLLPGFLEVNMMNHTPALENVNQLISI
ncbi:hypothetical protein BCR42DRAFT_183137 [Absidia repens]|uniref:Uncharacterized protein n=1 Tax=Absidia repens TaxID=90262 RepID=A0A1X2HYF3_9FUNG|nr:hypothetical protein BCR42DRAFT_183137 [Absidia repens]